MKAYPDTVKCKDHVGVEKAKIQHRDITEHIVTAYPDTVKYEVSYRCRQHIDVDSIRRKLGQT